MTTQPCYKFEAHLLKISESKDLQTALNEWFYSTNGERDRDSAVTCICQHKIWKGVYWFYNTKNGNVLQGGSECVKKFPGFQKKIMRGEPRVLAELFRRTKGDYRNIGDIFKYEKEAVQLWAAERRRDAQAFFHERRAEALQGLLAELREVHDLRDADKELLQGLINMVEGHIASIYKEEKERWERLAEIRAKKEEGQRVERAAIDAKREENARVERVARAKREEEERVERAARVQKDEQDWAKICQLSVRFRAKVKI